MGPRTVQGGSELAQFLRTRRQELGLTIAEAASKAGVGTKTWSRYEAGESIRRDKYTGVCKALNIHSLPDGDSPESSLPRPGQFRSHPSWSAYIEKNFGAASAVSFAAGSDILIDALDDDIDALSSQPKGTHIGELDCSMLDGLLPSQFRMEYGYDFLYLLRATVRQLCEVAASGQPIIAHTVLEELALYLITEESRFIMDEIDIHEDEDGIAGGEDSADDKDFTGEDPDDEDYDSLAGCIEWDEWIYEVFGDEDLVMLLYSGIYLDEDSPYHFSHWTLPQFFLDEN